jgi:hypothetical protein
MMENYRHFMKPDGAIKGSGVDYGGKVRLIHRAGPFLVINISGSMVWSGVGSPWEYGKAEWYLVEAELPQEIYKQGPPWCQENPQNYNGREFRVVKVLECQTPGRKWKACRDELIEKAQTLEKKL